METRLYTTPKGLSSSHISLKRIADGTYSVLLDLGFEKRYIGKLQIADQFGNPGTFFCKRSSRHLHKKTDSLGINYSLLTNPQFNFKWIVIDFEGEKLVTSRDYWLAKGRNLQFGKAGFELQSFLSLSEFGIERARQFEAVQQLELFGEELLHD